MIRPTVLLVEDEPAQRELLAYNLEAEGFDVITADNGEDGLILVDENDPDLIVLDWMMPQLSGIEVCRRLKSNSKTRQIPVATMLLIKAGIASPESLKSKRPYVFIGCFVVGMLVTPPDVISQTLLAVPMWLLFEVGLIGSRFLGQPKSRTDEDVDDAMRTTTATPSATFSSPA